MFFDKTEQSWPGKSHVRKQVKGSILFGLFVGAVGWSACFHFVIDLAGLTVGLVIDGTELTGKEVAISFLG